MIRALDKSLIQKAIQDAERETMGEIRVSIAVFFWGSVRKVAERTFVRLGMTQTRLRNGVLLFVVPSRRRYHILCDSGIPDPVREELTSRVSKILTGRFREGLFSSGLVEAVEETALILKKAFPPDPDRNVNELPDEVDIDNGP
ncbi:MAG: TPM domain-containing protein [Acidobacteria bacterium]|nr:TPM domain-containing protein [Acidobacteriota bacterium]